MDDEQNSIIESILKPLTTLFSTDLKAIPEVSSQDIIHVQDMVRILVASGSPVVWWKLNLEEILN